MTMLEEIIRAVRGAQKIYKSAHGGLGIKTKSSDVDLVTEYDGRIQQYLFDELGKSTPGCSFLGEEGDGAKELTDGYCFIIDPIDGTTNFVKGFQHSAISVGLAKDKELIAGVVLDPDLDNLFYAEKGKGAYLNGKRIQASACTLKDSLVLFGTCPYERELAEKTFELTKEIFYKCLEVRRSGSAALDICYVAAGKADLYYELILRPWDIAAASVILKEAGGICMTADGGEIDPAGIQSYVCSGGRNLEEFFSIANGILQL
ncbi:MAG TPA: inositol monophosphatase [Candidatus Eubacterium faecipullorum]|uniref:Inositol-1-monophosphatase n=1 Tax=Candidatus Eubacterium faecipullorum TaxID=2838571 RepID=A0A9D1RB41_9FIRM|nr:inositol monophosphatase [Candidatus Eubacterium faecipullorum]